MIIKTILAIIAFLSISSINSLAKEIPLKIISPSENTLQSELTLNIIFDVESDSVDRVNISTYFQQIYIDIHSSRTTYCKNISLRMGENKITIISYKEDKIINRQVRNVYIKSKIYYAVRFPPEQYKQQFFHTDTNEKKCTKCHNMKVNGEKNIAFMDVTESNCYECHKNITKEKYAHSPSANWLCTTCHNGNTGIDNFKNKGKSKFIAAEPVYDFCFTCHKQDYELWESYRFRHEPLDSGRCNQCHNPHSSPNRKFLRKPDDQICFGCHQDESKDVQELNNSKCSKTDKCITCHNPHVSNKAFYIREDIDKYYEALMSNKED